MDESHPVKRCLACSNTDANSTMFEADNIGSGEYICEECADDEIKNVGL